MLRYKTHADAGSLYNTPPTYGIYICGKVFKWLKEMGGLEEMKKRNEKKAKLLYDFLDQSRLFKGTVEKKDRSLMNVPFITGDELWTPLCKGVKGRGTGKSKRAPYRRRYESQHLQCHAHGRRGETGCIYG